MNTAIGVWTLVLGGVLIPGVDSTVDGPGMATRQAATVESSIPGAGLISPGSETSYPGQRRGGTGSGLTFPAPRFGSAEPGQAASPSPAPALPEAPYGESPQVNRRSAFQDSLIPFAPTDPSAASNAYPWGPPTAASPPEDRFSLQPPLAGAPSTASSGPQVSGSAAYVRPSAARPAYRGYSPYSSYASQAARIPRSDLARGLAYPSVSAMTKPYEDYRRPPSVSPYMELGRISSYSGDIDNYSQYVRPRLEQLNANQQMGSQIRGLQNSMRTLGRQTQSLQGIVIPQYYMNYGSYYPRLGQ